MTLPYGYKTFVDGAVLPADEINGYLMQGILVFDNADARDTALVGYLREGMYAYMKDTNQTRLYTGSQWVLVGGVGNAVMTSGGSVSTYTLSSITYSVRTFTSGTSTLVVSESGLVDLLIVGGGGCGGGQGGQTTRNWRGGGGGGGVFVDTVYLAAGSYTVRVGAGSTNPANNGQSSYLGSYVGIGGGSGQKIAAGTNREGTDGGNSGGGMNANALQPGGYAGASAEIAGGGGAGSAGSGSTGGSGRANAFQTGSNQTYGVGGNGGSGTTGSANTGNGGGGATSAGPDNFGTGGSGIVVVRTVTS